jgi:hypothetical protein
MNTTAAGSHAFALGFLSEVAEQVPAEVRARYSDWRAVLLRTTEHAVSVQHDLVVHVEDQREVFAAALFARLISSCQAAVLLLERGLVPQARCVLRAALEALFALAAIAEKPEVVARLVESHEAEQRRAAKNIGLWQHPDLKVIASHELASGRLDEALASKATSIATVDLAAAGGFEDWYRSLYMTLSWSVHGAAIDLERHFVKDSSGVIVEMCNEPDLEDQQVPWLVATELQLKAILMLQKVYPEVPIRQAEELGAELMQLAGEIAA